MAYLELTVFDRPNPARHRLGYLLLRDGHAVPLRGISPPDIKAGAQSHIPNLEVDKVKHRRLLTAIVQCLGFSGDFGTFEHEGWPAFDRFLRANGCIRRAGLFPVDHGGCIDLHFSAHGGPQPRQLADRIFLGKNHPKRVFLGYGVDWSAWDNGDGHHVPREAIESIKGDRVSAEERARLLFQTRHELAGQWGFLDDKLIQGPIKTIVDKTYWMKESSFADRKNHKEGVAKAVRYFRNIFDVSPQGWVDILRYNDRLAVLKAPNGDWDLLWQNYRQDKPPQPELFGESLSLSVVDIPQSLMSESDRRRAVHFRQDVWAEMEEHEAEQAFYDRGGSVADRRLISDADLLLGWAYEKKILPTPERARLAEKLLPGFKLIEIEGRKIAVSKMVTVQAYRQFLVETGYGERRHPNCDDWSRANDGASDDEAVGLCWVDAQAYCAWIERSVGVGVRLPTRRELRSLRPAYSPRHEKLAEMDFPWEHFPPHSISRENVGASKPIQVPSAIAWSEPRFLDAEEDVAKLSGPLNGITTSSRKNWVRDFPPHASWERSLPLQGHSGLEFIDAWDAYEWCQEKGWMNGRFWEGQIASTSWGAYKNSKVTFRLVLDIQG